MLDVCLAAEGGGGVDVANAGPILLKLPLFSFVIDLTGNCTVCLLLANCGLGPTSGSLDVAGSLSGDCCSSACLDVSLEPYPPAGLAFSGCSVVQALGFESGRVAKPADAGSP